MAWTAPLESDNSTHLKANGTLQNVHSVKVKEGEVLIPSGEVVAKVRIFIAMRHSSARLLENSQGFEETLRDNNFRFGSAIVYFALSSAGCPSLLSSHANWTFL